MKSRSLKIGAIGILIAVCLIMLLLVAFADTPIINVAYAADSSVDCDKYTDSDTLYGGTKTIRDYANTLHHSTVSIEDNTLNVNGDDPIVQIVPKELFATRGEKLHIGKD